MSDQGPVDHRLHNLTERWYARLSRSESVHPGPPPQAVPFPPDLYDDGLARDGPFNCVLHDKALQRPDASGRVLPNL